MRSVVRMAVFRHRGAVLATKTPPTKAMDHLPARPKTLNSERGVSRIRWWTVPRSFGSAGRRPPVRRSVEQVTHVVEDGRAMVAREIHYRRFQSQL
jgi:hypothetical protein